jgi:hypothetical protein
MNEDEELKNVLDEIGNVDPLPTNSIDITKIEPPLVEEPVLPVFPSNPTDLTNPATTVVANPEPVQFDPAQLLRQYLTVYEKFLVNYDSDRAQIEKTIKHLEDVVFNMPGAPRVNLEMLVAALRTKAETNGNIVKALDSVAKILAAAKGTQVLINNNNSGSAQMDLAKILSTPAYPDEKR